MGMEIERKFLVRSECFKEEAARAKGIEGDAGIYYRQGYIPTANGMTVRIRIAGDRGFITLKDRAIGFSRHEFEYEVPKSEAEQMLSCLSPKDREIFKRIYIDGDSIEEVSRDMDMPKEQVYNHTSRSKKRLRKIYTPSRVMQ